MFYFNMYYTLNCVSILYTIAQFFLCKRGSLLVSVIYGTWNYVSTFDLEPLLVLYKSLYETLMITSWVRV